MGKKKVRLSRRAKRHSIWFNKRTNFIVGAVSLIVAFFIAVPYGQQQQTLNQYAAFPVPSPNCVGSMTNECTTKRTDGFAGCTTLVGAPKPNVTYCWGTNTPLPNGCTRKTSGTMTCSTPVAAKPAQTPAYCKFMNGMFGCPNPKPQPPANAAGCTAYTGTIKQGVTYCWAKGRALPNGCKRVGTTATMTCGATPSSCLGRTGPCLPTQKPSISPANCTKLMGVPKPNVTYCWGTNTPLPNGCTRKAGGTMTCSSPATAKPATKPAQAPVYCKFMNGMLGCPNPTPKPPVKKPATTTTTKPAVKKPTPKPTAKPLWCGPGAFRLPC